MGITGLLPALKSIQVTRHLSEFRGKTLAVDAYVWLHRGVYSCAIELATGKATNKYVEYAMHRVRLLRHYGIEPYIVFDGGPLPAKKGTEKERKQKREEYLAKGNAFMAQGKSSLARECFVKCVDVTPQMAFQFIKALRAESVPYVVAPYEADAQLAYLEKIGIADGILTEDSDLLVFGCQTVLLKLDTVAATVISISRKDFGSVCASAADVNGISLIGWSDIQFRSMAILSGCDYLPSIPGIGLKTACSLLKKWKTGEQVIKVIAMEGKKSVPQGYLKQYRLAEKCFQHQRVYCPRSEKLVHLTEVGQDWNEEFDAYVGGDIDPSMAKQIALGNCDPVSYLPMIDINPKFLPRVLQPLPVVSNSPSKPSISTQKKGKGRQSLPTPSKSGGLFDFFGPNPTIPREKRGGPAVTKHAPTGKASGKRTLAEVMDQDIGNKKRHCKSPSPVTKTTQSKSKFFAQAGFSSTRLHRRHSEGTPSVAGPSKQRSQDKDKENLYIVIDDDEDVIETSEPELDVSELSLRAQYDDDIDTQQIMKIEDIPDTVEQEDGYISPSPSTSKDAQDLSSPPAPQAWQTHTRNQGIQSTGVINSDDEQEDDSFGAPIISSPISAHKPKPLGRYSFKETPRKVSWNGLSQEAPGTVLAEDTPTPRKTLYPDDEEVPSPTLYRGPDLRKVLVTEHATELGYPTSQTRRPLRLERTASGSGSPPSPSPETPDPAQPLGQQAMDTIINVDDFDLEFDDEEVRRANQITKNARTVMNGWREKWALHSKQASTYGFAGSKNKSPSRVKSHPQSAKKVFTPGSRPVHPHSLKRSNANVMPGVQQVELGYKPRPPATSELSTTAQVSWTGKTPMALQSMKQKNVATSDRKSYNKPTESISDDGFDDVEEVSPVLLTIKLPPEQTQQQVLSATKLKLVHYRCDHAKFPTC